MILKQKDPINHAVESLESLLAVHNLSKDKHSKIKKELSAIQRGAKGERECAFLLDHQVADHPSRVLIHDLRIECDGEIAQFDHLLLNRRFEFWILESKYYSTGIKINELGEFEYWAGNRYIGIPSPIEQVNRQSRILKKFLRKQKIQIQRLGLKLHPKIYTAVLVAPATRVIRPNREQFNTDQVMKADAFFTTYQKRAEKASPEEVVSGLAKLVKKDTIIQFGQKLVKLHSPAVPDYAAKFLGDLRYAPPPSSQSKMVQETSPGYGEITPDASSSPSCPTCGENMVLRTAKRGDKIGQKFYGCSRYPTCRGTQPIS